MRYYLVEPEVAGGLGPNCIIDYPLRGMSTVKKLHYVFDGWLGDELLESVPCFIVTQRLADALRRANLSGWLLDDVEVGKSEQFQDLCPSRQLPKFLWLKVNGVAGTDDFGIAKGLSLVVSERALEVLRRIGIPHADVALTEGGAADRT